jgi:hypothetical protein
MHEATLQYRLAVGACFGGEEKEGGDVAESTNTAVPGSCRLYLEEYLYPSMGCHGCLHQLFAGASTRVRAASSSSRTTTGGSAFNINYCDDSYQHQIQEWQDEWRYNNQEHAKVRRIGLLLIVGLVPERASERVCIKQQKCCSMYSFVHYIHEYRIIKQSRLYLMVHCSTKLAIDGP